VVAGFCYAGRIAFEAAQQLSKLGGKVEFVILIDTEARPPNRYKLAWQIWRQDWTQAQSGSSTRRFVQSLGFRVRSAWHTIWWLLAKVKKRLQFHFSRPEVDLSTLSGVLDEQGMPLPWGILERMYKEMDKNYRLRALDSRGVLFRTGELDGKQIAFAPDDALGWEDLFTRGVKVIPVAGHHFSIWGSQIPGIAREINRVLGHRSLNQHDKEWMHSGPDADPGPVNQSGSGPDEQNKGSILQPMASSGVPSGAQAIDKDVAVLR
jgi:thioesterase domain-containing protein